MDVCCYNRPMDDQTQHRIYVETEAILRILKDSEQEGWDLIGSTLVNYELDRHSDTAKQQKAYSFYEYAKETYDVLDFLETGVRANVFQSLGMGALDSLHLAVSEYAKADVLLTTDDDFIKTAKRTDSKVRVINPLLWLMEALDNE